MDRIDRITCPARAGRCAKAPLLIQEGWPKAGTVSKIKIQNSKFKNLAILFILSILLSFPAASEARNPVTVYLAGDSTCANKQADKRPETGWGEMLDRFFKPGKVKIDNRALNGRSTKSFRSEGHWQKILDVLKKGDYVFIQFGHNDESKDKGERYSTPDEFKKNLVRFVEEVRAKKATPVLLTPVMRRRFNEKGEFYDTHGEYPDITRAVAAEYKTPLLDLHHETEEIIKQAGPDKIA